jgi:hypothetical protein
MRTDQRLVWPTAVAVAVTALLAAGCQGAAMSTAEDARPAPPRPIAVQVEPCVDRTETSQRELALQATKAFKEKLGASAEFSVSSEARYRLACDITGFVEGSALKRWVMPGWGATVGMVSAMLSDGETGEVLIIARANATVSGGGLYTIGAEDYIVPTAVGQVVERLRSWAGAGPEENR